MLLRTRDQPVYLLAGSQLAVTDGGSTTGGYGEIYSNGRRDRGDQRFDRDLGLKVEKLKEWQLEAIKQKREKLEYKIKRTMDYSDQIQQEMDRIKILLTQSLKSVDDQILDVKIEMRNPEAANVVVSKDRYGLDIGKIADNTLDNAPEEAVIFKQRGGPNTSVDVAEAIKKA